MKTRVQLGTVLAWVVIVFGSTAWAQTNRGAIAGTVTDPSGAVIGAADVVATSKDTGAEYKSKTTNSGAYAVSSVPAGIYELTVSQPGFKTAHLTGVVVEVNTTSARDIRLDIGQRSESVTVVGDTPTVQSETSDVGTVVQSKQVEELPLV